MTGPSISVVIPTYNRANYITKAIDSAIYQSYPSHEIVVVDDGSTDNTQEVLKRYDGRIKNIHQDNHGVSSARNKGIGICSAEWISFLDSDDAWHCDFLSYQAKQIDNCPGACVYITNALFNEDGKRVDYYKKWKLNDLFLKNSDRIVLEHALYDVIKYQIAYVVTATMKRETLLKVGLFNEKLTIAEDFDLMARMALAGPFVLGSNVAVEKYKRDEAFSNLTNQVFQNGIRTRKSLEYIYKGIMKNNDLSKAETKILQRNYQQISGRWRTYC